MEIVSPNFADLKTPNIEIKTFPDGDSYVRIVDIEKYSNKSATVFHRLYPNQNSSIIQVLLIIKTLTEVKCKVNLVSPYIPYSRQDKTFLEGESKSAKFICELLAEAGVQELTTFDCHFLKKPGRATYGGLQINNISLGKELIEHAAKKFKEEFVTITPDQGASYLNPEGHNMKKKRGSYDASDSKSVYRNIEELSFDFDVSGKNILIVDDMISTGGTMLKAVENIRKAGARKIACAAAHGFFLKDSFERLSSVSDFLFVSDSIPSKVSEVSIMPHIK